MRIIHILRLALLNLLGRKWLSLHILLGMTVSAFIFISVQGYASFLKEKIAETTESCRSANHVNCIIAEEQISVLKTISTMDPDSDIQIYINPYGATEFLDLCAIDGIMPTFSNSEILCGGKTYHYSESIGVMHGISDVPEIRQYHCDYAMIAKDELQEYGQKTDAESPILRGRMPEAEGELLIPECYLLAYDIPEEEVLGQDITIQYTNGKTSIILLGNAVVCGILKNDFTKIASREQPMLLQYCRFAIDPNYNVICSVYPTDYNDLEMISKQFQAAGALRVLIPDSYAIFQYLMKQYAFTKKLLFATSYFIIFSMLLNVLRIIFYAFRQRMQYAAMLCSLGMSVLSITVVYLVELILVAVLSLVLASGCFLAVNRWLMPFVAQTVGVTGSLQMNHVFQLISVTGISLLVFCLLTTVMQGIYLYRNNSAYLLTET